MKSCFMFGHADAPETIRPELERMIAYHYTNYGVRDFYVGSRGRFDRMAVTVENRVKENCSDLRIVRLLAYHPAE